MKLIKLSDIKLTKSFNKNSNVKIISTQLLNSILSIELPIKNKEIFISNVVEFLDYLNEKMEHEYLTAFTISVDIFIKYFSRDKYKQYLQILKDFEILTNISHENGVWYDKDEGITKKYRVHNSYLNNTDFTLVIFEDKKTKIKNDIKIKVDSKYEKTILTETLDYYEVFKNEIEYHKENNTTTFSLYSRLSRALSLNKKRYIKKGEKVDRIYHSFSNLSKVTRKCFKTKYSNIDLDNSQPTFLCVYLKINNIDFETYYQEVCENGKFYELFYDIYKKEFTDEKLLRKKVKNVIYKSFLFDFVENRKVTKRLKELFPKVWQALKDLKQKQNETLASNLQNIEAKLFNNINVTYSTKYFTLFDAIYFNNKKDKLNIIKQIKNFGKECGIKFSLSIED